MDFFFKINKLDFTLIREMRVLTFFDVSIVVAQSYMSLQRVQTQTGFHISGICSKTTIIAFTLFDLPNKPLR